MLTINGKERDRIFYVDGGVTAALSGMKITGGDSGYGGGVWNDGTLTLTACTISGNSAACGGGVSNTGTATLTGCTISGNKAYDYGGGVWNYGQGQATLTGCTISENSAYSGGGVWNSYGEGQATLTGCTISGNSAYFEGGGVVNYGTATFTGCTINGNEGEGAGGVFNGQYDSVGATATITGCTINENASYGGPGGVGNEGNLTLLACTISGNWGESTGGLENDGPSVLTDTIVAGNTEPSGAGDIIGAVSGSYNLIGTGGSGGLTNNVNGNIVLTSLSNLDLAPLGFYGGPTQTMALLPGSAAIGEGTALSGVTTDQRGFALDSHVDIGAFQFQSGALSVNTTGDSAGGSLPGELTLRQAVNLANVYSGAATIAFSPTVFATAKTITLDGTDLALGNTSGTETVTGPAAGVTVSGGGLSTVFTVDAGVNASFSGLTITGGSAADGAGLTDLGTATLTNCTLSGNSASAGASLEVSGGTLTLSDCSITSSAAAVHVANKAKATITGTVLGGGGTGIQVGASSSDTCTVAATYDDLSGEHVGVQNLQASKPVNATFDWWGSSGGPGSAGAATAVGTVDDSPWLGDARSLTLATADFLGFASAAGNSYVVTANTKGPSLVVSLGGKSVGTVTAAGTILFTGSAGSVTISGESGTGFSTDDFTITNAAVTFAASDAFKGASILFNGAIGRTIAGKGGTANMFNVTGWTGTGTLTAPAGKGTVMATKNSGFTLSNTLLTAGTMALDLSGITSAQLTDSGSGHEFTVSGWTGTGTLSGSSDSITAAESADTTLTNANLTAGTMSLSLSGFSTANLAASAGHNTTVSIDASAFTHTTNLTASGAGNAILRGGSGSGCTLTALGSGDDILIGGPGADTLTDSGTGHNILIGGGGGDTITGNGKDILISGTTSYDSNTSAHITALDAILAEWSSSDSYLERIAKIQNGITVNSQTYALNSTTLQPDTVASTVRDGSQSSQNNWFIVSSLDKVTKKSNETATIV